MPRWLRIIRGMVGTGLTFAAGVGAVSSAIGLVAMVVGKLSAISFLQEVGRFSVVGFLYFLFISISGHKVWSVSLALFNLGLLLLLGGGAAVAQVFLALP